jgi:LacI family transcriptional regulator
VLGVPAQCGRSPRTSCGRIGLPLPFPITFTFSSLASDPPRGKTHDAWGIDELQDHSRITIKEIAQMCGVSTQTVSRVINKRPDVSPATRQAIEAAIAATGFQPSAVARSLVQRRSQTLGVIVSGLRYFGVAQTLNGITEEAQAAGYGVLLKEIATTDTVDIAPVIEFMIAHQVEAIIFTAPQLGTNIATVRAQIPAACPPIIFLKSEPSPVFSTITIDNYGGARQATAHLLALGRRRIGHVAGPLPWREAQDRHDGWSDALRDAGVEPGPVVTGNWSAASGESGFEELLRLDPAVDGIFVANDQMALGVLHVAHARGIAIPDQIAVVGFDGLDEAAHFTPTLTTVVQPLRELGELAVREVLTIANDRSAHGTVSTLTLATELVVRESAPGAARPGSVTVRTTRTVTPIQSGEAR